NSTLPVNLVDFKSLITDCKYNIRWQVANELNVERYIVESTVNGRDFTRLAELPANGQANYHVEVPVDNQVKSARLFLRLRMVDRDGSAKFSNAVSVANTCLPKANTVLLFPNPAKETEVLTISSNQTFNGRYRLQVNDISGKIVLWRILTLQDAKSFSFPHKQLAAGKYFLLIEREDKTPFALSGILSLLLSSLWSRNQSSRPKNKCTLMAPKAVAMS
ncbi:MAG: T9SS type A sorting domain-containing protein, partial [Chitinophagaceae bacterium]